MKPILLCLCLLLSRALALPNGEQRPLRAESLSPQPLTQPDKPPAHRPLKGKFLHITDFHPDPWYKPGSSTSDDDNCHHGHGVAGALGSALTDCDTPYALVNATFDWLKAHVRDEVDFVIWTGDSARHDKDPRIPRTEAEVLQLNQFLVSKFKEVWGKPDSGDPDDGDDDPLNGYEIPIIPTLGNNDIMPHNIMDVGPNFWTKNYLSIWADLIPEAQRHSFDRGGWFFVEAIPSRLAVFNINSLYFFDKNAGVDGCGKRSEPGYEQMEWLRIQLQFARERGMKAILVGHVPPARTKGKTLWDKTCWQKWALWMEMYRDVVVGTVWGHMNIDHFILQDFRDIKKKTRKGRMKEMGGVKKGGNKKTKKGKKVKAKGEDVDEGLITIQNSKEYLADLRDVWAKIPAVPPPSLAAADEEEEEDDEVEDDNAVHHDGKRGFRSWLRNRLQPLLQTTKKKKHKHKHKHKPKQHGKNKIGGEFAERYAVSLVTASVVPNYFPSFRIVEYNITGLDDSSIISAALSPGLNPTTSHDAISRNTDDLLHATPEDEEDWVLLQPSDLDDYEEGEDTGRQGRDIGRNKHKKKKKPKKPKKPNFALPLPPNKAAPPGPAYSPQTFTWLSYRQSFANLTALGPDALAVIDSPALDVDEQETVAEERMGKKEGKGSGKAFTFELEYDTANDTHGYGLPDLTVRNWVKLARRIAGYSPTTTALDEEEDGEFDEESKTGKKNGKKKKGKGKKKAKGEKLWYLFLSRAYVGAKEEGQLREEFDGR